MDLSSDSLAPPLAESYNPHMSGNDFIRDALHRLCEREGGHESVADKAKVSPVYLWQVLHQTPLPSGKPRGLGPAVREKISKAYPHWLPMVGDPAAPYGAPQPIDFNDNPDYPSIRRVNFKLSAGASGFSVDYLGEDEQPIVFKRQWFTSHGYTPAKLFAIKVANGSMEPVLFDGDTVVVNTESTTPKDGVVFAANFEGEMVIKRLVRDAGQWWLASDNPDQRRYPRKLCDENVHLIGEIVQRQSERI